MVKFRHYKPNRIDPTKRFGFAIEIHPKYKGIDIYFGKHVFVFFKGFRK
jgi:hypothetical protein